MSVPNGCYQHPPALTNNHFSVEKRAVAELIISPLSPQAQDLTGKRFGRLLVVAYAGRTAKRVLYWLCECNCGIRRSVTAQALRTGATVSCGCYRLERSVAAATKHGLSKIPEYGVWQAMCRRCFSPRDKQFAYYGGRGITVCDRWRKSFAGFIADMGRRPSDAHSIDRIDNDGHYSPENCRWATDSEQQQNKRSCHLLTHEGLTLTIAEWSRRTGIPDTVIRQRVGKCRWPAAKALTTPSRGRFWSGG